MTSSTSTSDRPSPPWKYVWALAVAIVAVVVFSWEALVRAADLGPEYDDNRSLWADVRHRLNRHGNEAIALLGASRIQHGIDVATMGDTLGRPVFQLAVAGSSALATLEDLAVDPRFRGTVIFSVVPAHAFNRFQRRVDYGRQAEWLAYYRQQSYSRRLEQSLTLWLQGRLAFRSPDAKLTRTVPALVATGGLPERDFRTTLANRVVLIDYTKADFEADETGMMLHYLEYAAAYRADEWQAALNYFSTLVEILNSKGCQVIFVRMPSGSKVGALEEVLFPKAVFWDSMARQIDATFIHAADYPEMALYMSQDGSHIDSPRIVEFTDTLVDILRRNGLAAAGAR